MPRRHSRRPAAVRRNPITLVARFIGVACLAFLLIGGCTPHADTPTEPRDLAESLVNAVLVSDLERVNMLMVEPLSQSDIDELREVWTGSVQPSTATTMSLELAGTLADLEVYALMRVRTESGLDRRLDAENHGIELWLTDDTWKVARVW